MPCVDKVLTRLGWLLLSVLVVLIILHWVGSVVYGQEPGVALCPGPGDVGEGTPLPPNPADVSYAWLMNCGHCLNPAPQPTNPYVTPTAAPEALYVTCPDAVQIQIAAETGEFVPLLDAPEIVYAVSFSVHWKYGATVSLVLNALDPALYPATQLFLPVGPDHNAHGWPLNNDATVCLYVDGHSAACPAGTIAHPIFDDPLYLGDPLLTGGRALYLGLDASFDGPPEQAPPVWVDDIQFHYFGAPPGTCPADDTGSGDPNDDDEIGTDLVRSCPGHKDLYFAAGENLLNYPTGGCQTVENGAQACWNGPPEVWAMVFYVVNITGADVFTAEGESSSWFQDDAVGVELTHGRFYCIGAASACAIAGPDWQYDYIPNRLVDGTTSNDMAFRVVADETGQIILTNRYYIYYGDKDAPCSVPDEEPVPDTTPTPAATPTPLPTNTPESKWWYPDRVEFEGCACSNAAAALEFDGVMAECTCTSEGHLYVWYYWDEPVMLAQADDLIKYSAYDESNSGGAGGITCGDDTRAYTGPYSWSRYWFDAISEPVLEKICPNPMACVDYRGQAVNWCQWDKYEVSWWDSMAIYGEASEPLPTSTPTFTPSPSPTPWQVDYTPTPTGYLTPVPTLAPAYDCRQIQWDTTGPAVELGDVADMVTEGQCETLIPHTIVSTGDLPSWMETLLVDVLGVPELNFTFEGMYVCPDWVRFPTLSILGIELSVLWFLLPILAWYLNKLGGMN